MARVQELGSTGRTLRPWVVLGRVTLGLAAAVFTVSTAYQAALVLRILNWGHRGQPPPGHRIVLITWIVMVVAGLGLVSVRLGIALTGEAMQDGGVGDRVASALHAHRLLPLVSLTAVAVVVVGFYAPDPYYLNTNGSVEDGGTVSHAWIAAVVALAALASALARFSPGRALVLTAISLWFTAAALAAEGTNH